MQDHKSFLQFVRDLLREDPGVVAIVALAMVAVILALAWLVHGG